MAETTLKPTIFSEKTSFSLLKQFLTLPNILLTCTWLICISIGILPSLSRPLSILLFLIIVISWKHDGFYLFFAVFIFFLDQFYISASTPVYRLYSYLVLIKFVFDLPKVRFRIFFLPALFVFGIFSIFAVGRINARFGLNLLLDVIIVYCVLLRVMGNAALFRKFLFVFVMTAVAAGVYSLVAGNVIEYAVGREEVRSEEIVRYCATFGDANYAGFYYIVSIFTVLNLKNLNKLFVVLPILVVLHYFLLLTNSITGFICYGLCILFYILLRYPKKSPLIFIELVIGASILIYLALTTFNKISFVNNVIIRVSEQLRYLQSGRLDMFTSDRTYIWEYFYEYFVSQNILGKLFGGNVVTSMITESKFTKYFACHQSYLQGLLNFGIIGSVIVFLTTFLRFIYKFFKLFKLKSDNSDIIRIVLISNLAWIFFGFSIDYFLDWRFMVFYFL